MTTPEHVRLTEKLEEQLQFIRRSCDEFDRGSENEALRIATSLRIIFHDSRMSVSLVTHLGLERGMMLSSSRGLGDYRDYLSHRIDLGSAQPIKMRPLLGDKFKERCLEDWWNSEPVFVHGSQTYSRRVIVLSAANKDGGAHVDKELENYYRVLCSGEPIMGLTGNLQYSREAPFQQGVTQYPKNAHLALIRQFAHEVLASALHYGWPRKESKTVDGDK